MVERKINLGLGAVYVAYKTLNIANHKYFIFYVLKMAK